MSSGEHRAVRGVTSALGTNHHNHLQNMKTGSTAVKNALGAHTTGVSLTSRSMTTNDINSLENGSSSGDSVCDDVLPYTELSHRAVKIIVTPDTEVFNKETFQTKLQVTIEACRQLNKSSVWCEVPLTQASFIEDLVAQERDKFTLHHADDFGMTANLYLWLNNDVECKIPTFATHQVGVGAIVVNSRDEILVVRELRKNYLPWKIPGGLAELGEHLDEAATRETMEETGVPTKFSSVLSVRHTHGMQFGRSDLYFVVRLEPVEDVDEDGTVRIPEPVADASEIAAAQWIPLSEYREMVDEKHPMMRHIMKLFDQSTNYIQRTVIQSVVPGRKPTPVYHGPIISKEDISLQ